MLKLNPMDMKDPRICESDRVVHTQRQPGSAGCGDAAVEAGCNNRRSFLFNWGFLEPLPPPPPPSAKLCIIVNHHRDADQLHTS